MKMFPVLRKWRVKESAVMTAEEVPVYCKCRIPELPVEKLIECIGFHFSSLVQTLNSRAISDTNLAT